MNTQPPGDVRNTQRIERNSFWYGLELVASIVGALMVSIPPEHLHQAIRKFSHRALYCSEVSRIVIQTAEDCCHPADPHGMLCDHLTAVHSATRTGVQFSREFFSAILHCLPA